MTVTDAECSKKLQYHLVLLIVIITYRVQQQLRVSTTKLRLSSHKLLVERGVIMTLFGRRSGGLNLCTISNLTSLVWRYGP